MKYCFFSVLVCLWMQSLTADWSMYVTSKTLPYCFDFNVSAKGYEEVTLDHQIPLTLAPTDLIVSPDNTFLYLLYSDKSYVIPVDVSKSVSKFYPPIDVGIHGTDMAVAPTGKSLYVISKTDNSLTALTLSTNSNLESRKTISVGDQPQSIAVSPDGTKAFVCNYGKSSQKLAGSISCIDTTSLRIYETVSLSSFAPFAIVMHPSGTKAYILASLEKVNDQCALIPLDLSGSRPVAGNAVYVKSALTSKMEISPVGNYIYITNQVAGTITPVEVSSLAPSLRSSFYVGNSPVGIEITPDGNTIYVALSGDQKVVPVLCRDFQYSVGEAILKGVVPDIIVMSSDISPVANFSLPLATANVRTIFAADSSFSVTGSIIQYAWDFGDGTTVITKRKQVAHVYEKAGTYNVTLTVMNSSGTSIVQRYTGKAVYQQGGLSARVTKQVVVVSNRCG